MADQKRVQPSAGAYVALLRGINVGGKNSLPMDSLREVFLVVGCREVKTFIQSGNVVFQAVEKVARAVPQAVSESISKRHGLRIPVVLRSAKELQRAAKVNPFLRTGVAAVTLHVAFLAARPTTARLACLDPHRSPPDEAMAIGQEVYLRLPNGAGRSKFTNAYLDSTLGTVSTVRNWNTVLTLVDMATGSRT